MKRANARTMALYVRIGLADHIREVGLRCDCPMDVFVITRLSASSLLRLRHPSVDEAMPEYRATNDESGSLEPYQPYKARAIRNTNQQGARLHPQEQKQ